MQDQEHRNSVAKRLEALGHRAEDLRSSTAWQAWLQVARRFRTYSIGNQMLIAFQAPASTYVAGYRTWQRMNRQVRKGEHGIKIFAPLTRKVIEDDGTEGKRLTGYKIVSVFDVAQTDGEPLPEAPAWPIVTGCPEGMYHRLVELVVAHTPLVVLTPMPDEGPQGARGWLEPAANRLYVRDWTPAVGMMPEAQRCKTLLHELGHWFDPAVAAATVDLTELLRLERSELEIVAESAAWLMAQELGIESDAAVEHYLASWEADADRVLQVAGRVIAAADAIRDLVAKGSEAGVASGSEAAA